MSTRQASWMALALAVALLAALLLSRRASAKLEHADVVLEHLSKLARADAAIDRDVFDVRAGLVRHFDTLSRDMRSLRAAQGLAGEVQERGVADAWAAQELHDLETDVEKKEQGLEQLKTNTALLWNSSRHLPVALAAIQTQGAKPSEATERLAIEGARLGVSSGKELDDRLGSILAALKETTSPADDLSKTALTSAMGHAQAILEHRRRIDQLMQSILHSLAGARIVALQGAFARSRERALVVATAARTSAVVLGVLLVATLFDLLRAFRAGRGRSSNRGD